MSRFNKLSAKKKAQVIHHFRAAATARATQWDHEQALEEILGRDIEIDFAAYAFGFDLPATLEQATEIISEKDIAAALSE
jgi:hypothetical protein